jgi:hypothetical protein
LALGCCPEGGEWTASPFVDPLTLTASDLKGRVQVSAYWYDHQLIEIHKPRPGGGKYGGRGGYYRQRFEEELSECVLPTEADIRRIHRKLIKEFGL